MTRRAEGYEIVRFVTPALGDFNQVVNVNREDLPTGGNRAAIARFG
ncbi:MAG TPA: hypothetical protein VI789_05350 [Dehalococcoidia bacterium]|nr:hypothetical protein [Dehalococcoidia bacterium]